jgi:hypothetical protein
MPPRAKNRPVRALPAAPVSGPPLPARPRYHPWPDQLAGVGPRRIGPFDPCARACGRWSWVRFGEVVLCLPCAHREAGDGTLRII